MSNAKTLVIVESPAKAKKIAGYLGPDYTVMASVGHIRDLASKASELPEEDRKKPWAKLAVNVDESFQPYYVIHPSKVATIRDLKKALKDADELLLATDEDREGEAISWHLLEVLRPKVPVHRMVFNEITPEAIREAVANPRDLDMQLVDAQETRRIVDRLYGYPVSEVLWKKIGREARSAGRVQSVAVRLVVDRERERIAFRSAGYWDINGVFEPESFDARLTGVDGQRVVRGNDFDQSGTLTAKNTVLLEEGRARGLAGALAGRDFTVRSVVQKPSQRQPKAPFMTSSLQQEASNRLRWGSQRTMRVAQGLYENGYITYMRTDSTNLSEQAIKAARSQAAALYGAEYVSEFPRRYDKLVKNAQEAHEAIRPAGDAFRTPGEVSRELNADEFALYDLIWKRTVASQMVNAQVATTTVKLGATGSDGTDAEFTASGTVTVFPGFYAALKDITEESDDADRERELPNLREGQTVKAASLTPEGHSTNPPARFTEAKLVGRLEELGIGRPSTYASIMSTIVDRGYVWKKGSALVPSFTAFSVVRLLEEHFSSLIDYTFTASMEEVLDLIASGESDRVGQLAAFWRGGESVAGPFPGIKALTENLEAIDARQIATTPIAGSDAFLRVGRYGAYVERGEERANVPVGLAPDELTAEKAEALLAEPSGDRDLGADPESGLQVLAKTGRYGPYVTEVLPEGAPKSAKPRTGSLLSDMTLDTVSLDDALRLLGLPRVVGTDPNTEEVITSQNGRYGPYLLRGKDSRSLASEAEIFSVSLEQALALYAQPKVRRGRGQAAPPLREVGSDPTTGNAMVIREGRFGAYVTDGETNASLRTADDPATISVERASDLLSERRAKDASEDKSPAKKSARKAVKRAPATTTRTITAKSSAAKRAAKKNSPGEEGNGEEDDREEDDREEDDREEDDRQEGHRQEDSREESGGQEGGAVARGRRILLAVTASAAGAFIALEGGEGAGKSTQGGLLATHLRASGREVVWTREPGGTPASEAIRAIVLSREFEGLEPRAEALLFAAARGEHAARVIRPAIERGLVVICDRYIDSSVAYQGYGRSLGSGAVRDLSLWATGGLLPDLTILLDVDPVIGLARLSNPDRLEAEPLDYHRAVRAGFLQLAADDPSRYLTLDASCDVDDIARAIADRVDAALSSREAG